ncbi:precorrin-2 C(20)-methyltransferase [Amylibacter sp. SFDW26]|uniref:precorrin-2 C(20)-methyltransferase n=1 Tax=Amylibacter sp. SFDW26 TaxID=2652722 RepID=UPI001261834C|nr:precorrin-2 C(20)-methyltransferase [Amylibacter sp. SFDW26]KAB7614746.1 precorrin-2 C(20)-methyltransferase [Amylibacter sp. SFDW26]
MNGKLYGIGLGPGDPELMTLKAARLIGNASCLAYPTLDSGSSFARSIAETHITDGTKEIAIEIPMSVARKPAQDAYDKGAEEIRAVLETGKDVVVLCEGDPFFYGSFMYLFSRLSGDFDVEIVPGVNSVSACASVVERPLVARSEVLTIVPATLPAEELAQKIANAEAISVMKVGRHLSKVKAILTDQNLMEYAHYIERATLPNQKVMPLADAPEKAPYFSMILVSKGNDPWL